MPRRARLALIALALAVVVPGAAAADPLTDQQWHLDHVGTRAAWEVARGEDIVIAVIDTGVQRDHPDLVDRLVPGRDFVEPGTPPDDTNGHGTIVAGIVAATAGNDEGVAGVAPLARIMPVRVLDAQGRGSPRNVASGIRWATENGAQVINLSLTEAPGRGGATTLITTEVELAIREAALAGAVVIGAAGNEGSRSVPYRSGVPVLVVGATDREDDVWERSNYDRRTLFAPGVEIISTFVDSGYARADGTSFAAPIVAGGAALLLEQGVEPEEVRALLVDTAVDIGHGSGRVDLAAALEAPPPASPSPSPSPAASPSPSPRPPPPPPPPSPSPSPAVVEPPAPSPQPQPTQAPEPEPEPEPEPTVLPEVAVPDPSGDVAAVIDATDLLDVPAPLEEKEALPVVPVDDDAPPPPLPVGIAVLLLATTTGAHVVVRKSGLLVG